MAVRYLFVNKRKILFVESVDLLVVAGLWPESNLSSHAAPFLVAIVWSTLKWTNSHQKKLRQSDT